MYHSITIGDKNTFDDWHLLSVNQPFVTPPAPKLNYVDILGANGSLDYTEALTKMPRYQDRQGSWEFIVLNPGDTDQYTIEHEGSAIYDWASLYSEIMAYLHGKYFDNIVLEDDPYFTYRGRVWVNEWRSSAQWSQIVLNYRLEPFKYSLKEKNVITLNIDKREIVFSDNIHSVLAVPRGLQPSTLFVKATSSNPRYDVNDWAADCRVHFVNEELGIDDFFTLFGPEGHPSLDDIKYSDRVHNRKCINYYFFDRDVDIWSAKVSNISGNNNCWLDFGAYNAEDTVYGPVTLEYWWEEAVL